MNLPAFYRFNACFDKSQNVKILASLPMYDWPEIRPFTDQFWAAFAHHAGLSGALDHESPHDALWHQPELLFSQTCGYPFTHEFKGLLHYVATPHYAVDGCKGANYSSFIFARQHLSPAELRKAKPAVNSTDSMSGYLALRLALSASGAGGDFFTTPVVTGSHLASLAAVQNGLADVCAIDCVCVALAKKHRPEALRGLIELGRSPSVPSLPFVTRAGDIGKFRVALDQTFKDPQLREAREAMLLSGVSVLPADAYDIISQLEASL